MDDTTRTVLAGWYCSPVTGDWHWISEAMQADARRRLESELDARPARPGAAYPGGGCGNRGTVGR